MEQARNMHIEAIKIYLADTHIQPSSSNLESVGLGLVDDFIRSRCPVFYVSAEEPEDIFASSINIFDESEQTIESPDVGVEEPEDIFASSINIFDESEQTVESPDVGAEDYLEDGL